MIPLFINNIINRKPLPLYGNSENIRDWLYVEDYVRAIDLIFYKGIIAETYNIGGLKEWKNIDLIKVIVKTVDRLIGREEREVINLITFINDRSEQDLRYAIDSSNIQEDLGWEPIFQFEEGIERTFKWNLENQDWIYKVTSLEYQHYY